MYIDAAIKGKVYLVWHERTTIMMIQEETVLSSLICWKIGLLCYPVVLSPQYFEKPLNDS